VANAADVVSEVTVERRKSGRRASPELTARRRHEILGTAVRLFAEQGYEAASLDDIARELGFTKGVIYHYFPSKGTLLREAIAETIEPALARQQVIVDSSLPSEEKLRRLVYDWVYDVLFDYQQYLVVLSDRAVLSRRQDAADRVRPRRFVQQYRTVIQEGVRDGSFRQVDPGVAAQTVVQGIQGVARWYRPDGRLSRAEICEEVTAMLVATVKAPFSR
jgi:AcrR family transcriptional regulator